MTNCPSHRIAAVSMALLMLLSSTGLSIDAHYCQDQIQGISFIGKAKSCHDKQETLPCHKSKNSCQHQNDGVDQADDNDCCHNECLVIEKSDVDATSPQLADIQNKQLDFVAAFVSNYVFDYGILADFQYFDQYRPPLPDRDVQVRYQIFLI